MSDAARLQKEFTVNLYAIRGLTLVRGEGVHLISDTGERYLDLATNYGVSILGYGHPGLENAIVDQWRALPTLHGSFANDVRAAASQELALRVNPAEPGLVYWSNSGAEAIEAALKFAAIATGKRRFVACRGAYHGKTLGALSATWGAKYREPFEPLLWEFAHVEYGDPTAIQAALDERTAACILEPIQGESGIVVPPSGYLRAVRDICSSRGILLILDEVQTGTGRTGRFLAAEHEGVSADVVCLGKGLAGGIPIGATVVTKAVADRITRGSHSSTFGGNPLALAGVRFVLATLDNAMLERIAHLGATFLAALRGISHPLVAGARGRGLMLGLVVREHRDDVLRGLQKRKVLAIPAGSEVVRFLPPYTIEPTHIDEALTTLTDVLRRI
ncbi:MAG: aspartate aminotransferase family protein [Thermoanaerobaculales bacterium]